ncbi:MAG: FxDxF family PEP-CTERM protein [Burkholderiaceae bacterium]|nr:FxDxF family PEP-CTERM protein [Burkholderiaceae bacterium]
MNVDAGTSLATGIYGIDLATGNATLLGTYNGTLSGLTVSAVPEPQTYAMLLAGLVAVGAMARRRKA